MRDEILSSQPNRWEEVIENLRQPPESGETIAFEKHISFHFKQGAPIDWIDETQVIQLIRDPRAMVASYKNKYSDVAPIVDSLVVQKELFDRFEKRGVTCPIIDSEDVQKDPEGLLTALCKALSIPFVPEMLSWPEGARESDGVWGDHWYDAVRTSTGFRPYEPKTIELSDELEAVAEQCMETYEFFHARRLTA